MLKHIARGLVTSLFVFVNAAFAHEIRPAIADLTLSPGELRLEIRLNLEAVIAGIEPDLTDTSESANAARYDALRALDPDALVAEFDTDAFTRLMKIRLNDTPLALQVVELRPDPVGDVDLLRDSFITLSGALPDNGLLYVGWDSDLGPLVLRLVSQDSDYSAFLERGALSDPLPVTGRITQSFAQVLLNYISVGYTHIVPLGLDHMLFVVGLFLLSTRMRPLLMQISAFTVAHTITLALGLFDVVQVSPAIVEPLIALSIAYVAIENVFMAGLTRWRPVLIFGFGLLHGLGFAGVLHEFGLTEGGEIAGLIGFNLGVELGQISVVLACFLLVGFWFGRKPWYRAAITIPASIAVAIIGLYWFAERAFFA